MPRGTDIQPAGNLQATSREAASKGQRGESGSAVVAQGRGSAASGKAEIWIFLACGRFADVLLLSAKSQKSRQSQESVQVGSLHSRRTGARGAVRKSAESGRKWVG